jgi:Ca2+-dependent lipid-binding protein
MYGEVAVLYVESCLVLSVQVIYKTLSPQWNQTFEFPETGEPLILHVKDHNAVLPTASIGHCTVEYSMLSQNQSAEKWVPLQGVKSGEIRVKIARRVPMPDSEKRNALGTDPSGKGHKIAAQVRSLGPIDSVCLCQTLLNNSPFGPVQLMNMLCVVFLHR